MIIPTENKLPFVTIDRQRPNIPVVTLNRPDRVNALSPAVMDQITDTFRTLDSDREARSIVLTGAGRGFCAGADISGDEATGQEALLETDVGADGASRVGVLYRMQERFVNMMLAIHECSKPVVAAVHGGAIGGGMALALACDLRVATPTAKFASLFVRMGLSSCDGGMSYFLPRIVGVTRAADLMLTGRRFSGEEAFSLGMISRLATEGEHLECALELAAEIAANSEYSIWATKKGMWASIDAPTLRHALEIENRTQVLGTITGNWFEAAQAFRENRPPQWKPM